MAVILSTCSFGAAAFGFDDKRVYRLLIRHAISRLGGFLRRERRPNEANDLNLVAFLARRDVAPHKLLNTMNSVLLLTSVAGHIDRGSLS